MKEDKNERITVNHAHEFWHPMLENTLEYERMQTAIIQEELRARIGALSAQAGEDALRREFELVELEVLKNQTRMLNTFLLPGYPGVVTAIYKDVGEYVQAGEPVARVENVNRLLMVGFIQLRGAPALDGTVRITARGIFESTEQRSYTAKVVAVRGHNTDDDEWELLLEMDNVAQPLPLNFGFDPDTTTIQFA